MFVSRLFIAIFSFKLGTTENPQVRRDTTNEAKIKKKDEDGAAYVEALALFPLQGWMRRIKATRN